VIYTYIKYVASFMHILCWSEKIIDIFFKKKKSTGNGRTSVGNREYSEGDQRGF
jgi:hypothetical protein